MAIEDILKYENRDQLYKYLIDDFGLFKIEEKYDSEYFGNFYITLSAEEFLLCYVNDRSFMDILISSKVEPSKWFALSFVKDLIDNNMINADEKEMDNYTRIEELNKFLKNKFNLINELFNKKNYPITKMKIDEGLKQQFNLKFPR
ncbi:MAG: hypothetical protein A2W95_08205 [Bacteroidetes bacterium GWA2_40_14]|nr:MAG: hypothetical protein A2W95_08205 [Bacteroidetes bacterium GWA2_40_14]